MTQYLTVKQMAAKHPAFSEASLRYHIFNETKNGIDKAINHDYFPLFIVVYGYQRPCFQILDFDRILLLVLHLELQT